MRPAASGFSRIAALMRSTTGRPYRSLSRWSSYQFLRSCHIAAHLLQNDLGFEIFDLEIAHANCRQDAAQQGPHQGSYQMREHRGEAQFRKPNRQGEKQNDQCWYEKNCGSCNVGGTDPGSGDLLRYLSEGELRFVLHQLAQLLDGVAD